MRNARTTIPLLSLVVVLLISGYVFGLSSYTTSFTSRYGSAAATALGATSSANCTLCHPSGNTGQYTSYANDFRNNGHNYAAIEPLDSDRDGFSNLAEINALTLPHDANSRPAAGGDTTAPTVNTFSIPAGSTALTVSPITVSASDNTGGSGVNGYQITTTATAPAATAAGWSATAPTGFTFPAGTTSGARTLYAWARDGAGNVSASRSATVTLNITTTDTTAPTVSGFTVGVTPGSLTVSITTFSATDNVGVTGYLVNESPTKPLVTASGWTAAVPTGYTFASAGTKTLYAWAKDNANNVSSGVSRTVTVTTSGGGGGEADVESPEVMEFTLPLTSTSLTVPIVAFRAIDNVGATAYLITTTPTAPATNAPGWSATPPTNYTFSSAGAKTLYGWAKDAAGNVSESVWDNVDIAASGDRTPPVLTAFTIPTEWTNSLTVPIRSFQATDNVRVTGYMVTATSSRPSASASDWRSTPPTGYTFTSQGEKRLYPWVKDAAGNVSALWSGTARVNLHLEDEEDDD